MSPRVEKNVTIGFELGKIIVGLIACYGIFFYAGKQDEKVSNHETRIIKLEEFNQWALKTGIFYIKK